MFLIYTMGQRPSFDPNIRNVTNYYNDLVSYAYEPGSTMKIFTLAAAIQENVFSANEKYKSGTYKVGGKPVKDWNEGAGWGMTSFRDGLMRSSKFVQVLIKPVKPQFFVGQFGESNIR